jgi:hypothetical protein
MTRLVLIIAMTMLGACSWMPERKPATPPPVDDRDVVERDLSDGSSR